MTNKITLTIKQYGEMTIEVDRAEYESALAEGLVDHLLDHEISDMDTDTTITEPDGTTYDPYRLEAQG